MLIATHDGSFHADETLACAILAYLEDCEVVRSRDPDVLERADIIIDVSGINDHKHFDHHSPEFNLTRPNGINYATAGLMWLKFGHEYLKKVAAEYFPSTIEKPSEVTDSIINAAHAWIDEQVMYMVDLNDNGQLNNYINEQIPVANDGERAVRDAMNEFYRISPDIPFIVAMQNLPNVTGAEHDKLFMTTVKFLKNILLNTAITALNIEIGIAKVLSNYQGGPLLIMHEKLPWSQAVLAHMDTFKDCMLAIYPDRKRGWRIQTLPYSKAERFKNKLSAPKEWRGLDDVALDQATGLEGTIFVHRAGFTGGAMEFDTILAMAKLWLEHGEKA